MPKVLSTYPTDPVPSISRHAAIALSVVLLHVGFIYALYSGLLMRAVELVVPITVMSQFIEPPKPKPVQPPPPPPPLPAVKQPVKPTITKAPAVVAPLPMAIADPTPAINAPLGATTPQPAPAPIAAPVAAIAAPAPPAPAAVQLPSSDASYLQNPPPPYPPISRRFNEQGKSMVRVLIGADGQPQRAELAKSSGFARLDDAAVATVMRWRYVPGKRGGVAEAMWFNVPVNWVLE